MVPTIAAEGEVYNTRFKTPGIKFFMALAL